MPTDSPTGSHLKPETTPASQISGSGPSPLQPSPVQAQSKCGREEGINTLG